jgi:hypothetical protein
MEHYRKKEMNAKYDRIESNRKIQSDQIDGNKSFYGTAREWTPSVSAAL